MSADEEHENLVNLTEKLMDIAKYFADQVNGKTKAVSAFQKNRMFAMILCQIIHSFFKNSLERIFLCFAEAVALTVHKSKLPKERRAFLIHTFSQNIIHALEDMDEREEEHDKNCHDCSKKKH